MTLPSMDDVDKWRAERRHEKPALRQPDGSPLPPEYRTPFERDRDRILYSPAFRRLAAVTQVAAVSERRLLHNRLTHSLKVAQIGAAARPKARERPRRVGRTDWDVARCR